MMIITLAIIGLLISIYGITVERKLQQNNQYKAACDISDSISCTRPFLSSYRTLFGISNIWVSALYYCAIIITAFIKIHLALTILISAGLLATFIFAYILYFKIKSLCLICTSLYFINITLAITWYMA